MKRLCAKLKSRGGETLAEVLVALLVAALALTLFASMVSASFNMITQSRSTLETYYEDGTFANPNTDEATVKITAGTDSSTVASYTVNSYTGKVGGKDVTAYAVPTPTP